MDDSFHAVSYNMMAVSLGSNCIPWELQVSGSTWQAELDAHRHEDSDLHKYYKKHWHKRIESGDAMLMRRLWGARDVRQFALPPNVQAIDATSVRCNDEEEELRTLRGYLNNDALFEAIKAVDDDVYAWATRGPKVFQEVLQGDIVGLCEYDAHGETAEYRGASEETFKAALERSGYAGVLAKGPDAAHHASAGIGLFWKTSTFGSALTSIEELESNESFADIHNCDLRESYHPTTTPWAARKLMPAKDRRTAVIARLRHKRSDRHVSVVVAHLMTQHRDNRKFTRFPGEVRAGELAAIRDLVAARVPAGDAILVLGDYNLEPQRNIFLGRLASSQSEDPLVIDTGFREDGSFHWRTKDGAPVTLCDAFAPVHNGWDQALGACSSCTNLRREWLDYCFYTPAHLRVVRRPLRDVHRTQDQPMPDTANPSDHLPLKLDVTFNPPLLYRADALLGHDWSTKLVAAANEYVIDAR